MTTKPRLCTALLTLAIAVSASAPVLAQSMAGGSAKNRYANQTKLDPYPPEGGWQGLANLLEAAKPGVDTRLDPTPSQITDRIEELLNRGANEEALSLIERREAALGRADEAIAVYSDMTNQFPELPEPWNNLAAIYASRGELERAQDSLQMALRANPDYAAARANLGDIQLMMALRTYRQEAARGVPGMKARVEEIESLLKDKQPK